MKNVLYTDNGEIQLPTKWAICPSCGGEGKSSAYLGCYTADEMNDMDDDFRQDYAHGNYDRACSECGGDGKIKAVDPELLSDEMKKLYRQQERDYENTLAEEAAERRAGA